MKTLVTLVFLTISSVAFSQVSPSLNTHLQKLAGDWDGELEYLDFSDGKSLVKLATNIQARYEKDRLVLNTNYVEPNGVIVKETGFMLASSNNKTWKNDDGTWTVTSFKTTEEMATIIIEQKNTDNDKPAAIRKTITIGENVYKLVKEVKYEGTKEFFVRHQYNMKRFVQEQPIMLSVNQMQKDVALLKATFTSLHPGLYRYNTPEQMNNYFNELLKKTSRPRAQKEFYLLMAEFAAQVKCGHTFLNPLNLKEEVSKQLFSTKAFPYYFKIIDKRMFITHAINFPSAVKAGDEITKINGYAVNQIIDSLLQVSRGDGNNAIEKRISNLNLIPEEDYAHSLFDTYFPLFFPLHSDRYFVEVKLLSGKQREFGVPSTTSELRKANFEKSFGKIPEDGATWNGKLINENTAYLKFGTFAFWNSDFKWKPYLDSTFQAINKNSKVANLIIDLRGNEGGDGDIRDAILSYITAREITGEYQSKLCYKSLSIPDSLLKNLSTWDASFKKPKAAKDYVINEIGLYQKITESASEPILPNKNRFKGKVYLMTNPVCSSATFDMAWTYQANALGTIVGEPTGGTKQGLNGGEMFFFTLPNSKIEIDLPILYYYHKNVPDEGVKPEIIVRQTQEDIRTGSDSQLKAVLDLIQKSSNQ
jgi:hypothetical protein